MDSNPYEAPESNESLENSTPRPKPLWVKLALWGVSSRNSALGFMWFSILAAAGGFVGGFWDPRAWSMMGMVFAALWYWQAILWVDQHGRW